MVSSGGVVGFSGVELSLNQLAFHDHSYANTASGLLQVMKDAWVQYLFWRKGGGYSTFLWSKGLSDRRGSSMRLTNYLRELRCCILAFTIVLVICLIVPRPRDCFSGVSGVSLITFCHGQVFV